MACSRGKASPNANTVRRLFASSGGFCQNPQCLQPLFVDAGDKNITIGELAHIFSAIDNGPRTNADLTDEQRGHFDNIILLCANCHTTIDKAEEHFTDEIIRSWKNGHIDKINATFGVKTYDNRESVRQELEKYFRENNTIFVTYGPTQENSVDPENPNAEVWLRKVQSHILPNNRKVQRLVEQNYHLMSEAEKNVFSKLCVHIDDFESKHLGLTDANGSRFPEAASELFIG